MGIRNRTWDCIVLTVGNQNQKVLCEKLLQGMKKNISCPVTVIADDESGCRLGSGGALLNVIDKFCREGQKVFLINSGGMSKRSIGYALRGKAFADVGMGREPITLLEMIISEADRLSSHIESGLLVSCSDILLRVGSNIPDFDNNIGFCVRADFETASRHGVMIPDPDGNLLSYPHKVNASVLKKTVLENGYDFPLIDTGFSYFSDEFIEASRRLIKEKAIIPRLRTTGAQINLYSDIISLLCREVDKSAYLNETDNSNIYREIRSNLYQYFSDLSMKVCEVSGQEFLHFGTNYEILKNIKLLAGNSRNGNYSLNSIIGVSSRCQDETVLDNVLIGENCHIGRNCFVSDIALDDDFTIESDTMVCGMKLKNAAYVTIVCPIDENPKEIVNDKELWCTPRFYIGRSFSDSYRKYLEKAEKPNVSMEYCVENADYDYYAEHIRYISDLRNAAVWKSEKYEIVRKAVIDDYFGNAEKIECIRPTSAKVTVALPVRINFSGTWTDALPYCTDNGGQVINMAAKVDDKLPIKVVVTKLEEKHFELSNETTTISLKADEINKLEVNCGFSEFNLHLAALKVIGVTENTTMVNGIGIKTVVNGIAKGSGLGTSSILLAGCFRALGSILSKEYSDDEIIQMVFVAEQLMKTGGGWQDQIGGITPSLKISTSVPGIRQMPKIRFLPVSEEMERFFSQRLVLISTGERHFGRFMVNSVMGRYLSDDSVTKHAFAELKALNSELEKSIENNDINLFSECINSQMKLLRELSPDVTDTSIENIISQCQEIAQALCICGAGAGGYLLAVLREGVTFEKAREEISNNPVFYGITDPIKKITIYN